MTLNVSLCLGPDWIIYVWVKWSVVKLLESSAISISATTSFRGHDLCLVVWYWRGADEWRDLQKDRQMTKEGETMWEMDSEKGGGGKGKEETKERVTEQWEVCAVCQHKESEMSAFVLHQWVMAAIIPPNGYKQAILAHRFHTQMKQAEFSTVGIPRASMENGVWKHARHKDCWAKI